MLIAPAHGFVMMAMPKCASTSIEREFGRYAQITLRALPFKHINYATFAKHLEPLLASRGFDRSSYEVVSLFREPIEWVFSWYRYRSREQLADPSRAEHHHYSGDVTFDDFARAYIRRDQRFARVGRQAEKVRARDGSIGVDQLFPYEDLPRLVAYLSERVGKQHRLPKRNVSPKRPMHLSDDVRRELEAHLEPEYEIYRSITGR